MNRHWEVSDIQNNITLINSHRPNSTLEAGLEIKINFSVINTLNKSVLAVNLDIKIAKIVIENHIEGVHQ